MTEETPIQPEPDTRYESLTLYSVGSIPGIPGEHAPGNYVVDWQERTIRPAPDETSEEAPTTSEQPPETASQDAMPDVVPVADLPQETPPAQESIQ